MKSILITLAVACAFAASARGQAATGKIVQAAEAFLQSLDESQRKSAVFAFDDEAQRKRWSNFPINMVPRAGVSLEKMTPAQRAAAMKLLAAVLSRRGFEKVQEIMEGDEQLRLENRGRLTFGKDVYCFSILGTPSVSKPWMLQFGGHHLALNITIAGAQGILTPSLTAAQPALFTLNGKTVRPLGQESDKALALLQSLSEEQRRQAILNYRVGDLVLGPGQDGRTIQPEGLKASAMNERQRAMLLDVIGEWSGIVHDAAAAARLAEIKAGLADTWFAWSGTTTGEPGKNITAYYRIQGPRLVIEYSPQRMGGDSSLHVHTIYRDPVNDYGRQTAAP
jgi:hypothetical protein